MIEVLYFFLFHFPALPQLLFLVEALLEQALRLLANDFH